MKFQRCAIACALAFTSSSTLVQQARAQTDPATQQKIDALQKQLDDLKQDKQQRTSSTGASSGEHEFLERKPGDGIMFFTRGGEVSLYGNLDVSFDYATKGISGMVGNNGPTETPAGNGGRTPAISSTPSHPR